MAPRSLNITAVLLDLDGTIIDSAPDVQAALNRFLLSMKRPPIGLDQVKHIMELNPEEMVFQALHLTGASPTSDALPDLLNRYSRLYNGSNMVRRSRPFPKVPETLALLKKQGTKLAVCTNKPFRVTMAMLTALDLNHFFDEVIGGDSSGAQKPDPQIVKTLMARLKVTADQAIMIGDHRNDIKAGQKAGLPTLAAAYGYAQGPIEQLGGDLTLEQFQDLPKIIERLNRHGLPSTFDKLKEPLAKGMSAVMNDPRVARFTGHFTNHTTPKKQKQTQYPPNPSSVHSTVQKQRPASKRSSKL